MQPNQMIVNAGGAGSPGYYAWQANPAPHPLTIGAEMPPYWRASDGKIAKRVLRLREFTPAQQSFPGIHFSVRNWCGVNVSDILKQTVVDCPTDVVFAHHGWRTTTLALNWPGYVPNRSSDASRRRFSTYMNGNLPMTRQGFARVIAELIQDLYNCAKNKPVARGWEDWAFSKNKVHPSKVYILSAHYYRNVWVPELYVADME
ncbi:uncharacterized protein BJ212DRAFT_1268846 [Suillus subaureus]|uniref:Uncharacterized protein n=1 Tax=Suillus subaureus TaxID=48587 RepID=A0A9P7EE89_9AGAM|nr:uncharacterized protein BJ212DRAFT_1268846 [Suillus subaureus]KAG1818560.1 hypothetical protein BJ212DRAFT_1268846 [Suillus subaureus]